MNPTQFKSVGIIFSYSGILLAVYFFGLQPMSIFISLLAEFIILFFAYWILSNYLLPKKYNQASAFNTLLAGVTMIGFQFVMINLAGAQVGWNQFLDDKDTYMDSAWQKTDKLLHQWFITELDFFIVLACLGIVYFIRLKKLKDPKKQEDYVSENLFTQALALSVITTCAVIVIHTFEILNPFIVLVVVVFARILMEIYLLRKNIKKQEAYS